MLSIKWYNERQDRMENILDCDVWAEFIEKKKNDDTNKLIYPRMGYLRRVIENKKGKFSFDIGKRILEVDIMFYIYSVQYFDAQAYAYWMPQSAMYFKSVSPEFIKRINSDSTYREKYVQEFLGLSSKDFMELMKKAKEEIKQYSIGEAKINADKLFEGF